MVTKGELIVNNKKYKLVAPDGGWGYAICAAAIINYSACSMFAGCFGMIFNDFFIEVDMNSTSVTLLMGVSCMSVAFSGYFTSNLCKIMSMRKCALLSVVILNIGSLCTIFANTKLLFFLFQGVFLGAGFGVLYNITCTILNDYFVKRRLLFISIAQTATGSIQNMSSAFYTSSDSEDDTEIEELCKLANIKYQKPSNHTPTLNIITH